MQHAAALSNIGIAALVMSWYASTAAYGVVFKLDLHRLALQAHPQLPCVLVLTGLQLGVGAVLSAIGALGGVVHGGTGSVPSAQWPRLLKSGALHLVGSLATNAAFAVQSVGLTQLLKASEPLFAAALLWLLSGERVDAASALSAFVTVTGVAMTSRSDISFSGAGLALATTANLSLQARTSVAQVHSRGAWLTPSLFRIACQMRNIVNSHLMARTGDGSSVPPLTLLLLSMGIAFVLSLPMLLLALCALTPAPTALILALLDWRTLRAPALFVLYQAFSIWVLARVKPLAHALINCLKRGAVVGASVLVLHEPLSRGWMLGMSVAMAGLLGFTLARKSRAVAVVGSSGGTLVDVEVAARRARTRILFAQVGVLAAAALAVANPSPSPPRSPLRVPQQRAVWPRSERHQAAHALAPTSIPPTTKQHHGVRHRINSATHAETSKKHTQTHSWAGVSDRSERLGRNNSRPSQLAGSSLISE